MDNEKAVLIATIPKSGTFYTTSFLWCYSQYLKNKVAYSEGQFTPALMDALKNKKIGPDLSEDNSFGIKHFQINHSTCPGFDSLQDTDPLYAQWLTLHTAYPFCSHIESILREEKTWDIFNLSLNPNAKLIYLYRNPLDQFFSHYNHNLMSTQMPEMIRHFAENKSVPINTLRDFIFIHGALKRYIRQYYNFKQTALAYPKQAIGFTYERLMVQPRETFVSMLTHMGMKPKDALENRMVDDALALCSKESFKAMEQKVGRSLGNEPRRDKTHIRSGKVGGWQGKLTESELRSIELAFNCFDMSLDDFSLSSEKTNHELLPWLAKQENTPYPLDFFKAHLKDIGYDLFVSPKEKDELAMMKKIIGYMETSLSWRITAPLRKLRKKLRLLAYYRPFKSPQ